MTTELAEDDRRRRAYEAADDFSNSFPISSVKKSSVAVSQYVLFTVLAKFKFGLCAASDALVDPGALHRRAAKK